MKAQRSSPCHIFYPPESVAVNLGSLFEAQTEGELVSIFSCDIWIFSAFINHGKWTIVRYLWISWLCSTVDWTFLCAKDKDLIIDVYQLPGSQKHKLIPTKTLFLRERSKKKSDNLHSTTQNIRISRAKSKWKFNTKHILSVFSLKTLDLQMEILATQIVWDDQKSLMVWFRIFLRQYVHVNN